MATETAPGRAEIGLLDMIQTVAGDMPAAVAFYRDVLGAAVETESSGWSQVRLGGVDIGIHATPVGYEGWVPNFRVADIAAVRARLEAAGHEVGEYHDIPGGVNMRFTDPEGNALSVVQYGTSVAQLTGSA